MMRVSKYICALLVSVLGFASLCAAEETDPELQWRTTVGAVGATYTFHHDALQRRADYQSDNADNWRDGKDSGEGGGVQLSLSRGDGGVHMRYVRMTSDYQYHTGGGHHAIDSEYRDLNLYWKQYSGKHDWAKWGWQAGLRYLGADKNIQITEGGARLEERGDVNWYMLMAGYQGRLYPYKGKYFQAYGEINLLLGETSGLARDGNDLAYDGRIDEQYRDQVSVSYGLNFAGGIDILLYRYVHIGAEYRREWMYSFKGTDTGIVVFPDNDDAYFIENHHGVYIFGYLEF